MKVMFADVCDRCDKRAAEYTSFWVCQECGDTVCRDCAVKDSTEDETDLCMCKECAEALGD